MEIKPFKGLRFDPAVVGNVADCIAPPYDVIDRRMQDALYEKSPYNIVRIIRGRTTPDDTDTDNQYTRAAGTLDEFIATGALREDPTECIYAYVQDFEAGSRRYRRSGLVALGRLTEFGRSVQPHEATLEGPRAERLKLMHATAAQIGQIFMLYDDPEGVAEELTGKAASGHAVVDCTDEDGVRHRLYLIAGPADIDRFVKMMADKTTLIADGHHRYETALEYYAQTKNPAARYRMMTFVNMRDEGLIILPTHRLIGNLGDFDFGRLIERMREAFEIERFSFTDEAEKTTAADAMFKRIEELFRKGKSALGIYAASGCFCTAVLKDDRLMDSACPQMSDAARRLDVNVLHKLILERILGIGDRELASQSHIEYVKDIGGAIDGAIGRVDCGAAQAVFFMNPTRIEQVRAVAAAGEKMPQKSTFFHPKMFAGLVINKLPPEARTRPV